MNMEFELDFLGGLKEQGITSESGDLSSKDSKGTPYVTLCVGGIKQEGEPVKLFYTSLCKELITKFKEDLLKFLDGRTHIVWRAFPEIQHEIYEDFFMGCLNHRYQIRCRLTAYSSHEQE